MVRVAVTVWLMASVIDHVTVVTPTGNIPPVGQVVPEPPPGYEIASTMLEVRSPSQVSLAVTGFAYSAPSAVPASAATENDVGTPASTGRLPGFTALLLSLQSVYWTRQADV